MKDLEIRGAGNLLGDEQSGQIREVGFELYNHMLEEAVAELRAQQAGAAAERSSAEWTPQITIDAAALMPESFIGDLDLRLAMYRRLASLGTPEELEGFAAELTAASILYVATMLKAPISTTHAITAAIMGVGSTRSLKAVRWGVAKKIVGAWIFTFPGAGLTAVLFMWVLRPLTGV